MRLRGAPLLDALERHAPGSRSHAEATATYAFAAAVELGFDRGRAELVRETAKLHEIGKVYVPKDSLAGPDDRSGNEEAEPPGSHFEAGSRLARGAGIPDEACDWIIALRERFDGRGPLALGGDRTPVEARIIRGACACDKALAVTVKPPLSPERRGPQRLAVDALRAVTGHELDPEVVDALTQVLERAAASQA